MDFEPELHFTHAQLLTTGLNHHDIATQIRQGTLTRVRRGFYAPTLELDPQQEHLRLLHATVPTVDRSHVLSHVSAGVVHGLPGPRTALDRVTMTRRTPGHAHSSPVLRLFDTKLADDEVAEVGGLPVTTLARTASDLARTHPYAWAVAACDAALALGLPPDSLLDALERHPRLRGLPQARLAAAFADGRSQSPAESLSRVQFARHGIPAPELQLEVFDAQGKLVAQTDFAWPEFRLVGEVDGKAKYGALLKPGQEPEDAIMREKRREEAIRQAGYWIVRWDWELASQGAALARRIRQAMAWQGNVGRG
ncbi:endonuclease domain-containing protein [Tessaracoccus sp. OS52]|uniref:endonuclease domain-containing protein n=1 Tax=Tessaracoccus sp. OS52 TaxID=2886691 RepID=UPI001D12A70C|nr:endonuclease domain-containing protein [Tessaracoccus sp. OS52]MCC2594455.1 endonuclease domain-containing protein [Tessaracoccus sp. OS52]